MIKIYIKSLQKSPRVGKRNLKSIALKVFELESVSPLKDYEIGVTLVDDKYIRKLNKKYRKVDSTTDVLAFPIEVGTDRDVCSTVGKRDCHALRARNDRVGASPAPTKLLGDVYISLDRAAQQVDQNENLEVEVSRLLIHGVLHLLGYEHSEQMFIKQEQYLNRSIRNTKC